MSRTCVCVCLLTVFGLGGKCVDILSYYGVHSRCLAAEK
jgi:hypothetical protein